MFNFCLPTFLPGVPVTRSGGCVVTMAPLSRGPESSHHTHTPVSVWAGHHLSPLEAALKTQETILRVCDQTWYLLYYERDKAVNNHCHFWSIGPEICEPLTNERADPSVISGH